MSSGVVPLLGHHSALHLRASLVGSAPHLTLRELLGNDLAWVDDTALCIGADPVLFYPEKGGPTSEAKALCKACPLREACLAAALERGERYGIWGGLSEHQRRRLRKVPPDSPSLRFGPTPPAQCGTDGGYHRHRAVLQEEACEPCKKAHAAKERQNRTAANKERRERARECRKTSGTRYAGEDVATAALAEHPATARVWECTSCGGWHITTRERRAA